MKVSFPRVSIFIPFFFVPSYVYISADTFLCGEILYRNRLDFVISVSSESLTSKVEETVEGDRWGRERTWLWN